MHLVGLARAGKQHEWPDDRLTGIVLGVVGAVLASLAYISIRIIGQCVSGLCRQDHQCTRVGQWRCWWLTRVLSRHRWSPPFHAYAHVEACIAVFAAGCRSAPSLTIAAWFHLVSLMGGAILTTLGVPRPAVVPSGRACLALLGVGCASFLAQLLLNRGFQLEKAARGSSLNFTQVIW